MKKILFLPLLLLFFSTACKKKEDNTPKEIPENQFSLRRDDTLFNIPFHTEWFNSQETILMIEAGSPELNSGQYQVYFQADAPPGSYEYGASSLPFMAFNFYKNNKSYDAYDGTFHILSNDPVARRIEFRFEIKLYYVNSPSDNYEIKDGHVVVTY